jgi:hypothetical protein
MIKKQQAFVAYPARDQALADGIMSAVRKANAAQRPDVVRMTGCHSSAPGARGVINLNIKVHDSSDAGAGTDL